MALHDIDDLPFHQLPQFFNIAATSDPHYNDGYFFAFFAPGWYVLTGLRLHPNTNTMDAFAGIVHDGEQRNVRLSRALRPRYDDLAVGPYRLDIVAPMRTQRLTLGENPEAFSFDVTMEVQAPPFVEEPYRHYKYGKLINDLVRYTQVCRATGILVFDGRTIEVHGWHAMRDHSWGIRSSMGPYTPVRGVPLPEDLPDERAFRLWVPFGVSDHCGFFHIHQDGAGDPLDVEGRLHYVDGTAVEVTAVEHRFRHDANGRLVGGSYALTGDDGVVREYAIEISGAPGNVQGLGYYGGWYDLGSAGVYRGADVLEHDRHAIDTTDGRTGADHVPPEKLRLPTEYACLIEGPGGATGMGHLEHSIFRPFAPYGLA